MTKQKMIEIIKETEKRLNQELTRIEKEAEIPSKEHTIALAQWAGIYRLTLELKIPT